MHADIRGLADVREQQARVAVRQPADLDSAHAERAEISEQRLDTGEREQDTAQHPPRGRLLLDEEVDGVVRREGLEHGVVEHDEVVDAEAGVEREPQHHDGRECVRELGGAEGLEEEEDDEDAARRADDGGAGYVRAHNGETLHGAEDGLGGCEDSVGDDHGHS